MDNSMALLNRIPQDKLLHYLVGSLLAAITLPLGWPPSVLAVVLVGLWRELAGNMDPWDFLATLLGGCPVWLAFYLGHL